MMMPGQWVSPGNIPANQDLYSLYLQFQMELLCEMLVKWLQCHQLIFMPCAYLFSRFQIQCKLKILSSFRKLREQKDTLDKIQISWLVQLTLWITPDPVRRNGVGGALLFLQLFLDGKALPCHRFRFISQATWIVYSKWPRS